MLDETAGLPGGKASHRRGWRLQGAISHAEDYRLPGLRGLLSARKSDNGIQLGVKGYKLVDCNGLPPLYHYQYACILSHVMHVGPASPRFGMKECDESGMHIHLLFAVSCVTSVSCYFLWVMLWVLLYRSHGHIT